jgi:ribosomal protein S6--L-glutamate ligase
VVANRPRSLEIAVDKYLAMTRLLAAELPCPPTVVCQSAGEALAALDSLGGDVVVKPLFGGEGRGIMRVSDRELALRAFKTLEQLRSTIYVQKFIEHAGYDVRLMVIGDRVWGMRRVNGHDWRTNVARGARGEPFAVDADWAQLARRAASAVGATLAGVDVLLDRDGRRYVLEVNAVPGWKALARTLKLDVARCVLDHLQELVAQKTMEPHT